MTDTDDEFALLEREGISWRGDRTDVHRRSFDVGSGQHVSAIVWGDDEPEMVFLHGRGQNAHTWDSVARRLGSPLVAVDLPGHGHSDWRDDHDYGPWPNADAVATVIDQAAPNARLVVGMSLGGMTNVRLAAKYPQLVRIGVIIDSTPANRDRVRALSKEEQGSSSLLYGPKKYESFDEILRATAAATPGRPIESLRKGVLCNSRRLENGTWVWRWDSEQGGGGTPLDRTLLWEDLSNIRAPLMLVRAGNSGRIHDEDAAEFIRRQPQTRVEVVEGSGHSVQSDKPDQLVELINDFLATTESV